MWRMPKALLVVILLGSAWLLGIVMILVNMGDRAPARLITAATFCFWLAAAFLFRYLSRKWNSAQAVSNAESAAIVSSFYRRASVLWKLYIVSGGLSILLGLTATRNRDLFIIVGVVVWGFAAYLWFMCKKRGALKTDTADS